MSNSTYSLFLSKSAHHRSLSIADLCDCYTKLSPRSQIINLSQEIVNNYKLATYNDLRLTNELSHVMQRIQTNIYKQISTELEKKQKIRKKMLQMFEESKHKANIKLKDKYKCYTKREKLYTPILAQRKSARTPALRNYFTGRAGGLESKKNHSNSLVIENLHKANKKNISYCNINELS